MQNIKKTSSVMIFTGTLCLALALGLGFLLIAQTNFVTTIDQNFYNAIFPTNSAFEFFWKFITDLGDAKIVAVATLILSIILLARKKIRPVFAIVSAIGSAVVITELFKYYFAIERPVQHLVEVSGASYPSGHTTAATAFFVALLLYVLYHTNIKWKLLTTTVLITIPILIAFSRLTLGAHWLSDVVGGILLGLGTNLICYSAIDTRRNRVSQST